MYEELLKEFKIFREQIYAKFAEYDEILRTLIGSNSEKIVSTFTDENALKVIELYPKWAVGIAVAKDSRYQFNGKLYKVIQAHITQADWTPDAVPALYTVIDVAHSGTQDDPIPYNGNMALTEGLYYTQGGVTYLCSRSTGQPVYNALAELVGLYVEVV